MTSLTGIAAAAALLTASPSAPAGRVDSDVPTTMITVRPGDAATPQASLALLRRIERAAERVCGAATDSLRVVRRAVRASQCYVTAMDRTVARLDRPLLNQAYRKGE